MDKTRPIRPNWTKLAKLDQMDLGGQKGPKWT